MKKTVLFIMLLLMTMGCSDTSITVLTVASVRGYTCDGESGIITPCLLVKAETEKDWICASIEGLHYELGYEYIVEVAEEAGSLELKKVVSKTRTESADLPFYVYDETWPPRLPCGNMHQATLRIASARTYQCDDATGIVKADVSCKRAGT